MRFRLPSVSLKAKIVLALSIAVMAILGLYATIDIARYSEARLSELREKAQNLAELYAVAVSGSVWEFDKLNTQQQLAALKVVPGFQRAVIWEYNGPEFASVSARISDGPHVEGKANIYGSDKPLGFIMIRISRRAIDDDVDQHIRDLLLTNCALGFVLLLTMFAALHFLTRPLTRMTLLMQRFATGELGGQIPYAGRHDEVGRMADALDIFRDHAIERRNAEEALQLRSEELAELNADLRRARDIAESANRIKSEFLASMSHEIRTPMNGIVGMVHALMETPLRPDQQEKLSTLSSAAQNLLSLLNDILDISKIEAGRLELENAPFSLRRVVENLMALWRPSAMNKGLALLCEYPSRMPPALLGDANRLSQIIANFIGNAIKFTDHGVVKISINAEPLANGDQRIRISVRDDGIGIAPEVLPRLFQKFSQADSSTTRKFGGTGLGLAICKQLADLMGGNVGVESEVGAGSVFWFQLDFKQALVSSLRATELDNLQMLLALPGRRRLHLLVAEDNHINQLVIAALLDSAGHSYTMVADGEAAVAAVQTEEFDAVLMDIQMPVMDGVEATHAIRKLGGRFPQLPVIALTANAMAGDEERYLAQGLNDYVAKPINPDFLTAALRRSVTLEAAPMRRTVRSISDNAAFDEPAPQQQDDEDLERLLNSL